MKWVWTCIVLVLASASSAQPIVTETDFNEGKVRRWVVDFFDENLAATTPFSASYRVVTYAGNELTAETAISPLSSSVTIVTPAYTIPSAELNTSNANLPEAIAAAFVVEYTWDGGAQGSADFMWFSLNNVPNYPFP